MSDLIQAALDIVLSQYKPPYSDKALLQMDAVFNLKVEGGLVQFEVVLGYPVEGIKAQIIDELTSQISAIEGVDHVEITVSANVVSQKNQKELKSLSGIKNIIAVASGKGGVGKSTTTVNLALAMAAEGARVGILDADIYGPSQGLMLGIDEDTRPQPGQGGMLPVIGHGLQAMSMSFLIDEDQPMAWRGPMVSGALQQLLNQTLWDELDYLFIDMPPGTGDVQLTLSQQVPVTGSIIVTTPQDIALLDARKGIEMFRKVDIEVLGVVENMSTHVCSNCGHTEPVFGEGGGEKIAEKYDTQLLGRLPLTMAIREQADSGSPTVVARPDSPEAKSYRDIAMKVAAGIAMKGADGLSDFPEIVIQND